MSYRIYLIREALKKKKLNTVFSNPLNVILLAVLLIRSIFLRLIPSLTKMYFIRKRFDDNLVKITESSHDFKCFTQYTDELKGFVLNRCAENKNLFYENYSQIIADRLNKGVSACALLENGKIVSIFFTSMQNCLVDQVNYIYTPEKNEIVIIDIYTLMEYRKKGLYSMLLKHSINYYKNIGISTFVMWIMKHNRATIQAQLSLGFSEIFQTVTMFSWLGFNKIKVSPSIKLLKNL